MKSTKIFNNLPDLDGAIVEDLKICPEEMIDILLRSRALIYDATSRKINDIEEERLCGFIRDDLIQWCYDNELIY